MPRLAISKDFLPDYAALGGSVRRKVDDVFAKFAEHTWAGLHLEKLTVARDPRVRTIRIDQQYRGIVMAPERGDTYLLVRVLPHDKADQWVASNTFNVNAATGALEVENVVAIERRLEEADEHVPADTERLFAGRSAKDFTQLGIPAKLVPLVERVATDDELDGLLEALPQSQADALRMLAAGYSVQQAWEELIADQPPGPVDPGDVEAALDRPASQAMFYVAQDADELLDVLNRPFDLWRTFLHPTQRRLAYRERYAGSVRVTGGAGTGKTVVAMHRAKALATTAGDQWILLTTFTRNLAAAIEDDLRLLGGPELLERVEVLNVDRLAWRVVQEGEGKAPAVATDAEEQRLWRDVVDELGLPLTPIFLQQEWLQVVLARGIASRDAYLVTPRPGRGVRLSRRQRVDVWRGIEQFTNSLVERGKRTHTQMADAAAGFLAARSIKPYSHIIVDEAQDLHPAQWRMLRAAVAQGPNDLFILADTHQRIYDNRVTLSSLGINVRGRSHRLRLNYRTTHEILRRALDLLTGETFDDLDMGEDTLRGYRSQFHGPPPRLEGYTIMGAELAGLVATVNDWLDRGVPAEEVGVAARTVRSAEDAQHALNVAGLRAKLLGHDSQAESGQVNVGTMHRMKGLEFRCVAVVAVGKERLPLPSAVTQVEEDPVSHRQDLQRERCLLYVACTRARDDLLISWTGEPSPFLLPLLTAAQAV
jgi:hypothetical protein